VLSRIRSINEKYLLEDVRQIALKRWYYVLLF
jgi:hypothetical protein